jgi:hypothetical protein
LGSAGLLGDGLGVRELEVDWLGVGEAVGLGVAAVPEDAVGPPAELLAAGGLDTTSSLPGLQPVITSPPPRLVPRANI